VTEATMSKQELDIQHVFWLALLALVALAFMVAQ
jgi:hypothetical protein